MPTQQTTHQPTRRPMRPCWHRACAALSETGACDKHPRPRHGWKPDTERGTRHERGYDAAWSKTRALVLRRDRYLCQVCRRQSADQVDHIQPKARGGTDGLANLQAICEPCHRKKTSRESRR